MEGDGRVKVYIAVSDFVTDQRPVAVYGVQKTPEPADPAPF